MRVLLLAVTVILIAACSNDPVDPAAGSTGVLDGTVEVYDAHLQRVGDASGVLVRFYDTDGKKFETTTNADGLWEIALPFGVYQLDTLQHPSLIQLEHGLNHGIQLKGPIDWLGKGRRRHLSQTRFCPETLESVVEVLSHSVTIDSTFISIDSSDEHRDTAVYKAWAHVTCNVKYPVMGTHRVSCVLQTSSGVLIKSSQTKILTYGLSNQSVTVIVGGFLRDFSELDNAKLIVSIDSEVLQGFLIPSPDPNSPGWHGASRPLIVPPYSVEFPLK